MIRLNPGKPVQFQIADKIINTIGEFKNSEIGSGYVIQGIYAAQILRDQQALDLYSYIPVSFTEQANQEDLIWEIMLHFLQTIIQHKGTKDEAAGAFHHISRLLDWDEYKKYIKVEGYNSVQIWKDVFAMRKPIAEYLLLPTINIYHYILYQNQAGFEQAVYKALVKWKEYYTLKYTDDQGNEQDHSTQPQGFLALPIAATCAYAFDKGMKLETVQSDYIPNWMIEGRFDEFELLVKGNA
ncbi:immunity 49 family protein [Spirosoma flavus]